MSLIYRRHVKLGEHTTGNVSTHGVSLSERLGRLTVNSRGRAPVLLGEDLSWRVRS